MPFPISTVRMVGASACRSPTTIESQDSCANVTFQRLAGWPAKAPEGLHTAGYAEGAKNVPKAETDLSVIGHQQPLEFAPGSRATFVFSGYKTVRGEGGTWQYLYECNITRLQKSRRTGVSITAARQINLTRLWLPQYMLPTLSAHCKVGGTDT